MLFPNFHEKSIRQVKLPARHEIKTHFRSTCFLLCNFLTSHSPKLIREWSIPPFALQNFDRWERKMPARISHCQAKGSFFNVRHLSSTLFQALGQWRRSKNYADDALSFPARTFCARSHLTCGDTVYSASGGQNIKPKKDGKAFS